jgi:hypothetical protein
MPTPVLAGVENWGGGLLYIFPYGSHHITKEEENKHLLIPMSHLPCIFSPK